MLERRVKLVVGDDIVAVVVIVSRERAVHEKQDVLAAHDGVVDAKLIHVAHERRTTRAIDPVTDAKILSPAVAERDVPRERFANQLSVDVKLHPLQERVDGDRDVVPTTVGDGDFRRRGVRAHVRRGRRFREKPERPVDVVAAAQMTFSAAQQVHRPSEIAEDDDGFGLARLPGGLDPSLDRETIVRSHDRIEGDDDVLVRAVEVKRTRSPNRAWRSGVQGDELRIAVRAIRQDSVKRAGFGVIHAGSEGSLRERKSRDKSIIVRMRVGQSTGHVSLNHHGIERLAPDVHVAHVPLELHRRGGAIDARPLDGRAADDEGLAAHDSRRYAKRVVEETSRFGAVEEETHLRAHAARVHLCVGRRQGDCDVRPRVPTHRGGGRGDILAREGRRNARVQPNRSGHV